METQYIFLCPVCKKESRILKTYAACYECQCQAEGPCFGLRFEIWKGGMGFKVHYSSMGLYMRLMAEKKP